MSTFNPPISLPFLEFVHLLNPKTNQSMPHSLCAKIESRLADCYDAYGYGRKGKKKCADLFYDFHECQTSTFQFMRFEAIRKERMRLYREGKLKKPFDEHPPIDGLLYYGV